MENNKDIIFYGDPHGDYNPLIKACMEREPLAIFVVGDMADEADSTPIHEKLSSILERDIDIFWIPGNHETDNESVFDATFGSLPDRNINGQIQHLENGLKVAGLGGVFRGRVWYPKHSLETPANYIGKADLMKDTPEHESWRGGIPMRHHTTIFKEDADRLAAQTADILITHEAPSSMGKFGFTAIDHLAGDIDAKAIIHGHQHVSYEGALMNGVYVKGLGTAEVYRLEINT